MSDVERLWRYRHKENVLILRFHVLYLFNVVYIPYIAHAHP